MKNFFNTKLFIAILFFCVGFLANHLFVLLVHHPTSETAQIHPEANERFPVDPDDFDQKKMLETIQGMQEGQVDGEGMENAMGLGSIVQREDEFFEYYDIPLKDHRGTNRKLNVELKNGLVIIKEEMKKQQDNSFSESSSEQMFTLDSRRLDIDRAEVQNEKDKIVIKIPKKKQ